VWLDCLFARFDDALHGAGYRAMGGDERVRAQQQAVRRAARSEEHSVTSLGRHRLSLEAQRSRDGEARACLPGPFPQTEEQGPAGASCPRQCRKVTGAFGHRARPFDFAQDRLCRTKAPHEAVRAHHRIARAEVKIGMVNLAYNVNRLTWLEARAASA